MSTDPLLASTLRTFDAIFAGGEAHIKSRSPAGANALSEAPPPSRVNLVAVIANYYGCSQVTAEAWLLTEFGEPDAR